MLIHIERERSVLGEVRGGGISCTSDKIVRVATTLPHSSAAGDEGVAGVVAIKTDFRSDDDGVV